VVADVRDATITGGFAGRFKYQSYYPGSDLELEQGEGLEALPPKILDLMRTPMVPLAYVEKQLVNGNQGAFFPFVVGTTQSLQALVANRRRVYLIFQNQGPGNIWFNFTNPAVVGQCLFLPTNAVYEPAPVGSLSLSGGAIVCPASAVWLIADLPNTLVTLCEGSWMPF
jgi:hypothetical protein